MEIAAELVEKLKPMWKNKTKQNKTKNDTNVEMDCNQVPWH